MEYKQFEQWRPVRGYYGVYEVSNYGQVRSLERVESFILNGKNVQRHRKGRILHQRSKQNGYYRLVSLLKNDKMKSYFVHRLVAEAFIPNPCNFPQVNHKDENSKNNFVWVNEDGSIDPQKSNLEWCSVRYNVNYGNRNEKARKKLINRKDLSRAVFCHELRKVFPSIKEAARALNLWFESVQRCCAGKQMQTKGYTFKYLE